MSQAFMISDELIDQYRSLSYDANAESQCCYVPLASVYWDDEHPNGNLPYDCDDDSKTAIYQLLEARRAYWNTGEIPPKHEILWLEAQSVIPSWPGFRRLELTDEQRQAVDACEATSEEFWVTMLGVADEVEIQEKGDGTTEWSATFNLAEKPEEKPKRLWWQFWK